MNKTTKATYDLAVNMLKGQIDPSEIAMMTGLPLEEIEKMKEDVVPNRSGTVDNLDSTDINFDHVLYDNNPIDESIDEEY